VSRLKLDSVFVGTKETYILLQMSVVGKELLYKK